MMRLLLLFLFFGIPAGLEGVEFYTQVAGKNGLAWLDDDLALDSLATKPRTYFSLSGFRAYTVKEGGVEIGYKSQKFSVSTDCFFQFHDLLASGEFMLIYHRTFSSHISGNLSINWTRASPSEQNAIHEFSLSWRLKMHPLPGITTVIGFDKKPALTLPEGSPSLNTPAWYGTFNMNVLAELCLLSGVYCREGFNPDWGWGTTFQGGQFTEWNMAWFSLSRAFHASFSLQYRSWRFQWICRWHPFTGLCSGSSVCREF